MPKSSLSDEELAQLISAIVTEGGRLTVAELLDQCHEHKTFGDPGPNEKYFHKEIVHHDFAVHIPFFRCNGDTVMEADIQFRRPTRFPSPMWSRNRPLVTKLRKLLAKDYFDSGIEVKDCENGGRQIHYIVSSDSFWWSASTPFEKWKSECAIYDEPDSSGTTDPDRTSTRNDFVILRFKRKVAT